MHDMPVASGVGTGALYVAFLVMSGRCEPWSL